MYANITQISFKTIYKCKIIFHCGNYPYREGVEIISLRYFRTAFGDCGLRSMIIPHRGYNSFGGLKM